MHAWPTLSASLPWVINSSRNSRIFLDFSSFGPFLGLFLLPDGDWEGDLCGVDAGELAFAGDFFAGFLGGIKQYIIYSKKKEIFNYNLLLPILAILPIMY
jgi:hypothetical protein